jgi:Tfp pilus assembly protein PilV
MKAPRQRRHQRGMSLIEALMAFLVVTLGMLGLMRSQDNLRLNSEAARHRGEALRLAQQTLEEQRAFVAPNAVLASTPSLPHYAAIQSSNAASVPWSASNTDYKLSQHVDEHSHFAYKTSRIEVAWTDRRGQPQHLGLHTLITGQDPTLAAVLSQAPRAHPVWGVGGRSHFIPPMAHDLGDGRSSFKPSSTSTLVWLFDNRSGRITAICTGLPANMQQQQVTNNDLSACSAVHGLLLSGLVRFSWAQPPAAQAANDEPLPLSVELSLSSAPTTNPPQCVSEALKVVQWSAGSSAWVPLNATPASLNLSNWTETGERFVSYHCLVDLPPTGNSTPAPNAAWSGHSHIHPQGWSIGLNATQHRVCRYSSDTDGSGTIDRNEEHPAVYTEVRTPLNHQHFLVVRGDQICPASAPVNGGNNGAGVVDWGTVQHQP